MLEGDPPRLVAGQPTHRHPAASLILEIEVGERLPVVVGRPVRQYLLMAVIWRRSEKRRGKCTIRISTNARHVHAGFPRS
jgi:hypothetical protein